MVADHGITPKQLELMQRILASYADRIERVDLFGSRALGGQRPNSDVDIAIRGALAEMDADRLDTLFRDSSLPFSVDVIDYARISHPRLRAHIDRVARPLFSRGDLECGVDCDSDRL